MSLNWREIDLILSELPITDSHSQKVRQPDYTKLLFELYRPGKRWKLLISLRQASTRLHEARHPVESHIPLQRFAQLLRSRIQGGKITEAVQIGEERIVRITVVRGGELSLLFARLWGGASNIILTDDSHEILDAFYRRPKRGEVSGEFYDPQSEITRSRGSADSFQDRFQVRPFDEKKSFNRCIEDEYRRRELEEERDRLKKSVDAVLSKEKSRLEAGIRQLEETFEESEEGEGYKQIADLIMSNLHRIEKGMEWLEVENYYRNNEKTEISLDPKLSPQKNAEAYYERHGKAKRGAEKLKEELEAKRAELNRLGGVEKALAETEDLEEELRILREIKDRRKRNKAKGTDEEVPGMRFQSGPFLILVGRNSRENDTLLRRYAKGNDYWIHARDFPGSYVFIRSHSGKSIPLETLLDAANLALYYSKARNNGRGELYYTQVKHLRRAKDGKEGLVLPTKEKNLSVVLDRERLNRLFSVDSVPKPR